MMEIAKNENYSIFVDLSINRLYITSIGFWNLESVVDSFINDQEKAVAKLKRNFTVVADMREFKSLPQAFVSKEEMSQKALLKAGMYRVAVILPSSVIASIQLKKVTTTTNMPERQFSSIEDGEKWLNDELKKI